MKVQWTVPFEEWVRKLRDQRAKGRIATRLKHLSQGHFGETRFLGRGLAELKIDYGPGYRIYFAQRGEQLVILLCGGDKSTQDRDIARARKLLEDLET